MARCRTVDMCVLIIYSVFIYFYANVEANRIKEDNPCQTFTYYEDVPRGPSANAAAYSSGGSAASSAVSSGGSAASSAVVSSGRALQPYRPCGPIELPPQPVPRPCGSHAIHPEPVPKKPCGPIGLPPAPVPRPCASHPIHPKPIPRPCGSHDESTAPVLPFPFGSGVRSSKSAVASSSGGAAASAAVSTGGSAVRPERLTVPYGSGLRLFNSGVEQPGAYVARPLPYRGGVKLSGPKSRPRSRSKSRTRSAAAAAASTSGRARGCACAHNPMKLRKYCHESTWIPGHGGQFHCNGDKNAIYKTCPNPCPPTCRKPHGVRHCHAMCVPHGCECKPGFVLSDEGRCIQYQDCPGVLCNGDRNATYKTCPDPCPSTCALLGTPRICNKMCLAYGCECNKGYHINDEGKCVLIQDCPGAYCDGDRNATLKECPNPCPGTCELPGGPEACIAGCPPLGCECKEGYFLNDKGKCVQLQDCPGAQCCSANETFVYCKSGCPTDYCPVDDSRDIIACDQPFPCPSGCVCKGDYLKLSSEDETCILATDCPSIECTRPDEVFSRCPPACLNERCSDIGHERCCDVTYHYCRPQCICKPDHYRNDSDICVPKAECEPLQCSCNETAVECKTTCPPQSCEISYTEYLCPSKPACERGCDCLPNYLRNASGICILNDECPPPIACGEFEVPARCRIICPPQTCDSIFTTYNCGCQTCEMGCDCIDGYLRNKQGVCIPSEQCFVEPECDVCEECRRTCSNPTPQNCPLVDVPIENVDGCKCKKGYILSHVNGNCIEIIDCPEPECDVCEECRRTCSNPTPQDCPLVDVPIENVDRCKCKKGYILSHVNGNCIEIIDCPEPECDVCEECRRTCSNPTPQNCPLVDVPIVNVDGCKCKKGYILSHVNGNCIKITDCPEPECDVCEECRRTCSNPTPQNCPLVDVPIKNVDGCKCKKGYILSHVNGNCIEIIDCPEPECDVCEECRRTCSNPTPQNCPLVNVPIENVDGCKCKKGYILSHVNGNCIEIIDCPEPGCDVCEECRRTCSNPTPQNCPLVDVPIENVDGCKCKKGYILSHVNGNCIEIIDCPDPECDVCEECRRTCSNPTPQNCPLVNVPIVNVDGCKCKKGYILSHVNGNCIEIIDCPEPECDVCEECRRTCSNPTPQNCPLVNVPIENVDGCKCKKGYILSHVNGNCIEIIDCPEPECDVCEECRRTCSNPTPQNCPLVDVPIENVDGCKCKKGYILSHVNGNCIEIIDCPEPECDICEGCRPTCSNPTPENCPTLEVPKENVDGCKCKEGYILSDVNGHCIEIEHCPDGCKDDPNAIVTACPWPCPSTCDSPNASSCGQKCKAVGCQCKPGFILSEEKGKCILPDDCKCGNPCGENGTYSDCGFRCSSQYCPEDDSLSVIACKPGRPCPPGCMCKEYYRRRHDDDTCVLAHDCPTITCSRPNEVFDPCASECLAENCVDLLNENNCVPDPKNYQPKCVCCEGYYRDDQLRCVPKCQCPTHCDVLQSCRPTCAVPNPPNCDYIQPSETNTDCNCQSGYILDVCGGTCIKIEDCPKTQTCNGDPNASIKECPQPCPSKCSTPNATPCKRKCDPIGCECNAGYLLSDDGICILPDECKGGNPCGPNGTFVPCRYDCPNYCPTDDSRAVAICETYPFAPCFSGCTCKLNHKRLSREDPTCILSSECPPVDCTRPYEEWNTCPLDCHSEYCVDVDKHVICNTLVLNCNPKCVCRSSYFRNSSDICVSSVKCRQLNKQKKRGN